MNPNHHLRPLLLAAASASLLAVSSASATDGTWIYDGTDAVSNTWTTAGSWSGGMIADGTDSTANFSFELTAHRAITLGVDRNIGHIVFADTTSSHNLTLSGNTLNLDAASGSPSIDVTQNVRVLTLGSIVAGGGGIIKKGQGSLLLTSTGNSLSGQVKVEAGRLHIQNANSTLGDAANAIVVDSGGQLFTDGAYTVNRAIGIHGNGFAEPNNALNTRAGALRLGNGHTYTGEITLAGDSRIGGIGNNPSPNGSATISGKITGPFSVDFYGSSVQNNGSFTHTLSNTANNYTGDTIITAAHYNSVSSTSTATLKLGDSNVIPNGANAGNVIFAFGSGSASTTTRLDLNGFNETINGLAVNAGNFRSRITNSSTTAASVLTIGDNEADGAFSGIIQDSDATNNLGITKIGAGTLTLSGANTYRGGTSVSNGTLVFRNTGSKSASGTHAFEVGTTLGLGVATSGSFFTATDVTNSFAGTMTGNLSNVTVTATTNVGLDTTAGDFTYGPDITGSPTKGLTKLGTNTLTLAGASTYTGTTKVDAGTLKLSSTGSLANGTSVAIAAGATFDLTEKTNASATYTWNTTSLGASGAASPATITGTAGGTIDMGSKPISLTTDAINPSLTVTGAALALDANTFTVVVPGTALPPGVYTLVSAPSITGTVNPTASYTGGNGLVGGGSGVISIAGNNVILTVTVTSTPYDIWASSKGLTGMPNSSTDPAKDADPDNDGHDNLAEFAFNGNPLDGADNGKVFVLTEDSDFDGETADKELLLTVAVRASTPAFSGSPSPTATQGADAITYGIEGSVELSGFLTAVNVVPTPVTTDLPPAGAGYEYRSFSLDGSNGLPGKGFLRAKVASP